MSETLVEIRDLSFARGRHVIYDGISMSFKRGAVTAVMGPSGTGKTTLLRLIGGQLRPDSGDVIYDGDISIPSLGRDRLFEVRKRMSMLFQSGALFTDMSVFDNVAYPIREHFRLPEELVRTLVLMKLETVPWASAAPQASCPRSSRAAWPAVSLSPAPSRSILSSSCTTSRSPVRTPSPWQS